MVNISRLRKANYWMNENICLTITRGPDCELSMSAMHRVSGLESHNPGPAKLVKMKS
jgi:hypothetical protein